jgi:hypothetical protein
MGKLMIDIGGNVWVDLAAILIVEQRTVNNDRITKEPGSTVTLARPGGVETVDGSDGPLDIIRRMLA